ncbi:MAG TPA: cobalamin-dependent protein [Oscillospiraceae bacterium]|nr:cobalamin-dependent protein [Oscillospiraceae bacterium]
MKVLLINAGSYHVMQKPIIPLGLLSIATNLKNNLHDVMIYDRAVQGIKLDKVLKRFQPDIVGISALTFGSFKDAIKISKAIKKIGIPIVWGGRFHLWYLKSFLMKIVWIIWLLATESLPC